MIALALAALEPFPLRSTTFPAPLQPSNQATDRACIAASSLTSPEQLFRLRIAPGLKQLRLPLKEEMAERPLFRRCKHTAKGVQMSEEAALADTTLRPQMTNLGSITGMELPTGPYTFRRGNGQALDNSSK